MAEAAFRYVQIGKESTFGTEVDATLILPVDQGSAEFTLDRATEIPVEDIGGVGRSQSSRGSHGVRIATGQLQSSALAFELAPHYFQMGLGSATTTGSGTYTHVVSADWTSDTIKSYTFESVDTLQAWITTGVVIPSFEIGFDTLAAGENSMWSISADLQGIDVATGTATASQSVPATLQTMEGHLTQIFEGPAGTAYASLSELSSSIVSYTLRVEDPKPLRPYGGTADKAADKGRSGRTVTISALLKLSSTTDSNIFDIYNAAGALPTERRWRIKVNGSNDCSMLIDHKLLFTDVHIEPQGRDGERLMSVAATAVYDSTNTTDLKITVVNKTSSY